ncbi:MAG: hypothetical protein AB7I33_03180 [Gemmatimonadales bacterium]
MSTFRNEQRRLVHQGREFHFVSYDGRPANDRRGEEASPPMWYLMNSGKRWPVMQRLDGQSVEEVDSALLKWVEEQGL